MLKTKEVSSNRKGHTHKQWLMAILANTTTIGYGLTVGWTSPVTKILQSDSSPTGSPLSDIEMSWIASMISLAAVVGVSLQAYTADKYGRKVGIMLTAALQAACWIVKLSSANVTCIIIARICAGLAAAGSFIVVPIYVREISQDNIRGLLGSILILSQNVGILIMFALGAYLDYYTVLWIVIWLPVLAILLMIKAPESPAFLVKIGKFEEAASTIAYLRGLDKDDKSVQDEMNTTKNQDLYTKSLPDISFITIWNNKAWRRSLLIMGAIMTINSWNGSVSITSYASGILAKSGATLSPELQAMSIPAVMIVASIVSMNCVERFGRKPLLVITTILIAVTMGVIGSIMLIVDQGGSVPGWLPVVTLALSVAGYSAGISSVPFIVMSEMLNFQIRAKVMGVIVTNAWFQAFLQLMAYAPISSAFGTYTTFYIFAVINVIGVLIVVVFMPETKGKTVEQIETELRNK